MCKISCLHVNLPHDDPGGANYHTKPFLLISHCKPRKPRPPRVTLASNPSGTPTLPHPAPNCRLPDACRLTNRKSANSNLRIRGCAFPSVECVPYIPYSIHSIRYLIHTTMSKLNNSKSGRPEPKGIRQYEEDRDSSSKQT